MDNQNCVILVTSSLPGEGKSTLALNLAFAFAKMEHVLLIDADMRQPSIGKEFNLPSDGAGLYELIVDNATFSQCMVRREDENLDVLPSGVVHEDPLETLSNHKLRQFFQELRGRYDRIIIDSPPTLPVSDSAMLATYSDSIVFVVKSDATKVQQAKDALEKLRRANGTLAGVVINQLNMKQAGYGYDYDGYPSELPRPAKA
jgi:capsular exopolysaccharide synthesis family protein